MLVADQVFLDGSHSFDVEESPLTYQWRLLNAPAGSQAVLTGATTAFPALTPDVAGAYEVELIVHDGDDPSTPVTTTLTAETTSPLALAITRPSGPTVSGTEIVVAGTVTITAGNVGVTVNGTAAIVHGTTGTKAYAAAGVTLVAGPNVLTVTASLLDGTMLTRTQLVTSDGTLPALTLQASPELGLVPLAVTFTYELTTGTAASSLTLDFGDGRPPLTTTDPAAPLQATYASAGLYVATLTVTDDQAATYEAVAIVNPTTEAAVDDIFVTIWNAMTTALGNQDKAGALGYLTLSAQTRYDPAWDVLLPAMSEPTGIAAALQATPPELVWLSPSFVQYVVQREVDGVTQGFLVTFIRDGDGVWRVDAM